MGQSKSGHKRHIISPLAQDNNYHYFAMSPSIDLLVSWTTTPVLLSLALGPLLFPISYSLKLTTVILVLLVGAFTLFNSHYKTRGPWKKLCCEDTAIITGGAHGLGLEITKLLHSRRVRCIVIDKDDIEDSELMSSVKLIRRDLTDVKSVLKTIKLIRADFGPPTILINNAAIRHSEALTDLPYEKIHQIITVNTLVPAMFMKEFLQTTSRLYTINISSILGLASPARLSLYSATKAALISLHDSVAHEHKHSMDKRFLLVTPGQLDTRMFKDVRPPKQFLAPVIHAQDLAREIIQAIDEGRRGTLHGPLYTYFIPLLRMLPYSVCEWARAYSEMDESVAAGSS